jgi:hypothetical protein
MDLLGLKEARGTAAKTLANWFAANGWPQSITEIWAKATDSAGPWASQMSQLFNMKLDPKAQFFVSLGNFNLAVAEGDLSAISDRKALDRLKAGQPICTDDGQPYGPTEFFNLFVGHIQPPTIYAPATKPSQEETDHFWSTFTAATIKQQQESGLSDRKFWQQYATKLETLGFPDPLIDLAFEVVTAGRQVTASEMSPFWHEDGGLDLGVSR